MRQEIVEINGVNIPMLIESGGEKWFPISYLSEKVLLRKGIILFNKNFTRKLDVDYTYRLGGAQVANCVSVSGIRYYLNTVRKGKMNYDQTVALNRLMEFLNIDVKFNEDVQFIKNPPSELKYKLSEYDYDCYESIKHQLQDDTWQKCSKCNNYFPFHENFFRENLTSPNKLNTFCRNCGWTSNRTRDRIKHGNYLLNSIYGRHGLAIYKLFRDHDVIGIYQEYINGNLGRAFPSAIKNKDDLMKIIVHFYKNGLIDKDKLNQDYLVNDLNFKSATQLLNIHEIYQTLYGEVYYLSPWEYKSFTFSSIKLDYEIANDVFKNYIKTFKVDFSDPLEFNYSEETKKASISQLTQKDILYFAVQFNEFKYPGYKFKTKSVNYYKTEGNLLFDLKYLIEQDLKIHKDKIPLYLTRNNLQKHCLPLYHFIITNQNGSIFEWVDKLYPGKYCREDFDITPYRNEFDSDTEAYIHEILLKEFGGNVIYNQRLNLETVKLKGKVPDWFVFTDNGVWVIEYFGMIDDRVTSNNRIENYRERVNNKLSKYDSLSGYKFLYLYKSDIVNDYYGIREKIKIIKET